MNDSVKIKLRVDEKEETLEIEITPNVWRKIYAGMAMQGLCATLEGPNAFINEDSMSADAIVLADALIAELNKETK